MNYSTINNLSATQAEGDCLLLAVYQDNQLSSAAEAVDKATEGAITALLEFGDFSGKSGETHLMYQTTGLNIQRIVLVGAGDPDKFDEFTIKKATTSALKTLSNESIETIVSYLGDDLADKPSAVITQSVLGAADSRYAFTPHQSKKEEDAEAPEQTLAVAFSSDIENIETSLITAQSMALGCELSRNLSNQPGNVCNPTYLANTAKDMADEFAALTVEVLEEADMEALGMGSFLSVSQGSDQPGKMIVLQYNGTAEDQPPVALVGKGITFDTGGISLKPGASMDEMKFDMVGAASVLGTIKACAQMKLPINIVGVLAAAENMPSARATRPGDIVKSMAGKTIEVLNTDAEGRLVLCDALTYVGKYEPRLVIDIATLTGACIIALGHQICALLSNDQQLADDIIASGKTIGDQAWQLPMNEDYQKLLKSSHADIGNIGGRAAGTITAACFLAHFTEDYRWAHLDIAGTAWQEKDATGRPVPLLTQFLIDQVQ